MFRHFVIALAALLLASGCSQQRSRAVNEPAVPGASKSGERDYRVMIERSRTRQQTRDTLQSMQDAVQRFQRDIGRLPTNIVELVIRNYVPRIPELPANQQFVYKADLGVVMIANISPADTLTPTLPPAPELTNRPTLSPIQRP